MGDLDGYYWASLQNYCLFPNCTHTHARLLVINSCVIQCLSAPHSFLCMRGGGVVIWKGIHINETVVAEVKKRT